MDDPLEENTSVVQIKKDFQGFLGLGQSANKRRCVGLGRLDFDQNTSSLSRADDSSFSLSRDKSSLSIKHHMGMFLFINIYLN